MIDLMAWYVEHIFLRKFNLHTPKKKDAQTVRPNTTRL